MAHVRVLLAGTPQVLSDILQDAIGRHPDVEIVGRLVAGEAVLPAVERFRPNVTVLGTDLRPSGEYYRQLLVAWPRMYVLTVFDDGRQLALDDLRVHTELMGEASLSSIISAIRLVAAPV
jgi:DNA-binding NarL/FixJ family response regulator